MRNHLLTLTALFIGSFSLHAQVINFTGGDSSSDYSDPLNWDSFTVPDLTSGATAVIGGPYAVTYQPGSDFVIDNNSALQINAGGSWTQIAGGTNAGAYIQLEGNGGIVVNGGTFNQGTASSAPFNIAGTGNYFTINSGAANFNTSVDVSPGFTYTQNGGIVTVATAGEFDFNAGTTIINGGVLNTRLITAANAGAGTTAILTFSGGTINLSGDNTDFNGFYPANPATQYLNFTLNSTGVLNFAPGVSLSDVQNYINAGDIKYNGAIDTTDLVATNEGDFISVSVEGATVIPEPSTWALLAAGFLFLGGRMIRRRPVGQAGVRC